ncbi:MAG: sigma factor-like helix-turn-helix DNA-binding protein [Candidatus Gracilibacteria bacterium]|nr:sigma factor-like helix-turn-helix DNA-binding protein [Candidatus Gracilibacteria bacterium]MDD3120153.1 sigma factor-like helix-turn-helix DNA-binding protein [Candidatus Gracilibacteria bacterium]MDD4529950.1 sigma factor-like helix-turn-helix DNA-binding protein [Candidatus Gracilibacteria bacterium]
MSTAVSITESDFIKVIDNLSEKEKEVLSRRIGLNGEKETLQEIGNSYGITRERVRQIAECGIKKIGRLIKASEFEKIQRIGEEILKLHGGLLIRDNLVNAVINEAGLDNINGSIIEIILQSDFNIKKSKPQSGTKTYFYFPEISKKIINEIHKESLKILKKKKDIIETNILYEMIKVNLFSSFGKIDNILISSVLDIFTDLVKGEEKYIGLTDWKILNPTTLKNKAVYIMKKRKQPMHFLELVNEISNHFGEIVKVGTIHNELIRNKDFVLIGRGIYVLKEWGYKPGTVLDVIIDIFKKAGKPLSTEDVIKRVLKTRKVKKNTIYMNLQNKNCIRRVGRNLYTLTENIA